MIETYSMQYMICSSSGQELA